MTRKVALGMLAAVAFLTTQSAVGLSAPSVPHELRGAIILRSVGYESGFASRTGPAVFAVVSGTSSESADDAEGMASVFAKLVDKTTVAKRTATVVRIRYESRAKLEEQLRTSKAEVVYVARGLSAAIPEIPATLGDAARIVVCGDGDDIKRGCAIAVGRAGNKPELLLNVKLANGVGLRFHPQLLRLARIVD